MSNMHWTANRPNWSSLRDPGWSTHALASESLDDEQTAELHAWLRQCGYRDAGEWMLDSDYTPFPTASGMAWKDENGHIYHDAEVQAWWAMEAEKDAMSDGR